VHLSPLLTDYETIHIPADYTDTVDVVAEDGLAPRMLPVILAGDAMAVEQDSEKANRLSLFDQISMNNLKRSFAVLQDLLE
jgi:hypothetical protein